MTLNKTIFQTLAAATVLSTAIPTFAQSSQTKVVKKTIVLSKPGTYDFKGVLHVWKGKGKCNQKEGQPSILKVTSDNVVVKNFYWENAPDGVHVFRTKGTPIRNVTLDNIRGHACEDALTIRGEDIIVQNSELRDNPKGESDKTVAAASSKNLLFKNVTFKGGGKCIRFKSGADIRVEDSVFDGCDLPVVGDTTDGGRPYDPAGKPASYVSTGTVYRKCNRAFTRNDSKVSIKSGAGDKFESCSK